MNSSACTRLAALSAALTLAAHAATRLDPRTGEESDLPAVQGGTQKFTLPDAQDWVVRLKTK